LSIIAPFDGEVAVVYSQTGDSVTSGTEALILVDRSSLYVDVWVDESSILKLKTGQPAVISFQALGIETTGEVEFIDPIGVSANNVVNYSVRVKLNESDPRILIGATASVVIATSEPREVLYAPVTAVLMDEDGEYCDPRCPERIHRTDQRSDRRHHEWKSAGHRRSRPGR
jgi:multidrug efflux pump subunit AcrA (membrane-fusion protein)